jgi:AraC-like DNA-binding protein
MNSGSELEYSEIAIDAALAPYVRLIWTLESGSASAFGPAERILPDGVVEAVFHYRTPFDMCFRGETFSPQPTSFLVTLTRRFVEIRPSGRSGFIAVRFQPWGAYHFFSVPLIEFADRMISAEHVWGRDALALEEHLYAAVDTSERSRLVQEFLLKQMCRHHKEPVDALVRAVWSRRGDLRISSMCRDIGVTERRLERTFSKALGVSPKHFARLTRFLSSCRLLRQENWTTLADVAQMAGYYDQAHCIDEFRAFSGMTPRAFVDAQRVVFLDID